jgi:hypothetical protein
MKHESTGDKASSTTSVGTCPSTVPRRQPLPHQDLYEDGYGFSFSPNGSNVTVYPSGAIKTGYVHSSYGMVSMTDQGSTYDASTKTFTFNFKFTVSAGSFGTAPETLTLDK